MPEPSPADARLSARLHAVRAELTAAAVAAGRDPGSVTLVTVTKAAGPAIFEVLARDAAWDVGENRAQQAVERMTGPGAERFRWHFIGHVQSNKVRRLVPHVDVFHGVDSLDLARRIDRVAVELGRAPELLLQVNVSGEDSKTGLPPEAVPETLAALADLRAARLTGLMTMAPKADDPQAARPVFRRLAELARAHGLEQLSMGMTEDFAVAVEEGATLVRIGTRIVRDPEESDP